VRFSSDFILFLYVSEFKTGMTNLISRANSASPTGRKPGSMAIVVTIIIIIVITFTNRHKSVEAEALDNPFGSH